MTCFEAEYPNTLLRRRFTPGFATVLLTPSFPRQTVGYFGEEE